ncbi:MAG: hypothetical protein GF355_08280 [Candidatus Eisenbacteria bacterium]|nr:hypothetical protein [Candidatus Eisenbacteria bacterium]
MPAFAAVAGAAPGESFRETAGKIPRQSHRFSGRTAMQAHVNVSEPKPPQDPDAPLSFSMEGHSGLTDGALTPRFWWPSWNSVQALNRFQEEIAGPMRRAHPGVRLLGNQHDARGSYRGEMERPDGPGGDWLIVVPRYEVFGSEELSVLGPAVAARCAEPRARLNARDAERLGLSDGDTVEVELSLVDGDGKARAVSGPGLQIGIGTEFPAGHIALPLGHPGWAGYAGARACRVRRAGGTEAS